MDSYSVIVTACNNAAVLPRTLHSLQEAVAYGRERGLLASVRTEVVAVDDGSTDETGAILDAFARATGYAKVVRRDRPSSPSAARNAGAAAATGDVLFFLDGDDLYRPEHLDACWRALNQTGTDFVKTGVYLADPVHAD
jgi:glycosyltransferase involved in cell wall biosynthesis